MSTDKKALDGMSFVITGKTNVKRTELKTIIGVNGGEFMVKVRPETTYLIIADPSSQTVKANNAREMGIRLISEDQFFKMIA